MTDFNDASEDQPIERHFSAAGLARLIARWPKVFLLTATVAFVAVVLLVGSRSPLFRTDATIILRGGSPPPGSFAELVEPRGDLSAAAEMAILRSRDVAEACVLRADADDEPARSFPMTTIVDDDQHSALFFLQSLLFGDRRGDGRVWAAIEPNGDGVRPGPLRIEFPRDDAVRVGTPGFLGRLVDAEQFAYEEGEPFVYGDVKVTLRVDGDVVGRPFTAYSMSLDAAIGRVTGSTRVNEVERWSGVLQVTVEDSDPLRVAEIANGLAESYVRQSSTRNRDWASRTVDFIDGELARHNRELVDVEERVTRLMEEAPRALDVGGAATTLVQRAADLESSRVRVSVVEKAVEETLDLLKDGEVDVLAHLNPDLLDPTTRSLLSQLTNLASDAILLEREDESTARRLMMGRVVDIEADRDKVDVWIEALGGMIVAMEDGEEGALASMGNSRAIGLDTDPLTDTLLNELASLRVEAARLAGDSTDAHPRMVEIRESVAAVEARLSDHLRARVDGLEVVREAYADLVDENQTALDAHPAGERRKIELAARELRGLTERHLRVRLDGLRGHLGTIDGEIERVEAELAMLPEESRRLAGPQRRLESLRDRVAFLMKSKQEAEISRTAVVGSAEIVDPAVPPHARSRPRLLVVLLLGVVVALLLALSFVFLLETMRGEILDEEELSDVTGVPVVGAIPTFAHPQAARQPWFVPVRDDPGGRAADAYRAIAAGIEPRDGECLAMAVTSSTSGEGKTVANVDIAMALARAGKRVLLVDGDLRKPSLHHVLKIYGDSGFADVLAGVASWEDSVWTYGVSGLWVLPAGKYDGVPTDLLAGERLRTVIDEMRTQFDVILFDVPPAAPVPDVCFFARHIDMILLMHRRRATTRKVLASVAERLRDTGVANLGAVLNDAAPAPARSRFPSSYARRYQYA